MHAFVPTRLPFPTSVDQAPALATVLATMGHDCEGSCPPELDRLKAIWHVPRGRQVGSVGLIVVDVDDDDSITDLAHIVATVNRCTRRDRIRVRAARGWSRRRS